MDFRYHRNICQNIYKLCTNFRKKNQTSEEEENWGQSSIVGVWQHEASGHRWSWALHAHMHHVGQPHLPANVFFFLTRSLRRSSSCSCIRERVVPSSHSHPRASVPTLEEEQGAQCQTASYLVVRTWLCRGRVPSIAGRARVRACCQSPERRTVSKSDGRQSAQRPIKPKVERPKNRMTQTMETTDQWWTEKQWVDWNFHN